MVERRLLMPQIQLLDQITIDKIAAGEVIERPASVVKELVENAIDAGATAIVVEIEEGGIALMRITDNGCGIPHDEVRKAFLRHSTSKIRSAEDLTTVSSLGFRGEALSSISAVAQVELITKTRESVFGSRYVIEGGKEKILEETGAPNGTTFLVRQLFYNTPARRKFLRTAMTEASHVSDLITRLALSHPEISFQFINNKQSKLHTSGNGKLKDVIYHIYGRDITNNLLPLSFEKNGIRLEGFLGKPIISRGNRNFENYFVNGRYIKSNIISKGIEDAYKDYTMQHKYPFVAFHVWLDQNLIDINVHPTKMELRFSNQQEIYNLLYEAIRFGLTERELIPEVSVPDPVVPPAPPVQKVPAKEEIKPVSGVTYKPMERTAPAVREERNAYGNRGPVEEKNLDYFMEKMKERVTSYHNRNSHAEVMNRKEVSPRAVQNEKVRQAAEVRKAVEVKHSVEKPAAVPVQKKEIQPQFLKELKKEKVEQLNLFEEQIVKKEIRQEYTIIGQVFDTYWLIEYKDSLYIIDQHAAHERVLYERTLKGMKNREYTSQYLSPPIILSLSMQEIDVLETYKDKFTSIGFEMEPFGGDEYAVRAIPDNLFGIAKKELLMDMIDSLSEGLSANVAAEIIDEKIASMSCKAAVKGNAKLSRQEVDTLINELLSLENPYHCPHGRPTIIAMTKRELEKKFKRIV